MYAVVATGGKQYRVEPGTELIVERMPGDAGSSVTFDRVLLVGDGESVTVGTPTVDGASVSGTVIGDANGPKLVIFKFKQKVKYRRRTGHRQHLTRVRIDEISAAGKTARTTKAEKPENSEAPAKAASATKAEAAKAEAPEKPKRTRKAPAKADAAEKPKRSRTTAAKAASASEATADKADETAKPKRTRKAPAKAAEE